MQLCHQKSASFGIANTIQEAGLAMLAEKPPVDIGRVYARGLCWHSYTGTTLPAKYL